MFTDKRSLPFILLLFDILLFIVFFYFYYNYIYFRLENIISKVNNNLNYPIILLYFCLIFIFISLLIIYKIQETIHFFKDTSHYYLNSILFYLLLICDLIFLFDKKALIIILLVFLFQKCDWYETKYSNDLKKIFFISLILCIILNLFKTRDIIFINQTFLIILILNELIKEKYYLKNNYCIKHCSSKYQIVSYNILLLTKIIFDIKDILFVVIYLIFIILPQFITILKNIKQDKVENEIIDSNKHLSLYKENDKICIVKDIIDNYYFENIDRHYIAYKIDLHVDYMCKLFKNNYGCSVNDYIRKTRMKIAYENVVHTNKKIIDIAFDCGYESLATFYRHFNQEFNKSPLEIRNEYQN